MAPFVLRVGLRARPCLKPTAFSWLHTTRAPAISRRHLATAPHVILRPTQRSLPLLLAATVIAGSALGISSLTPSTLHCDDVPPPSLPPPPKSSVNAYELAFGTVCGLCAGVFVKKSARVVAFFLGGLFVVLQYLGSVSLVKVNWARMASRFENLFYTTDAFGNKRPPTVWSVWKWMVDFLTADFQPRASFIAGLALGLRVG